MQIKIANTITVTPVDDEAVITEMQSELMYGLNPVATKMWQSLSETHDIEATVQAMMKIYDVEESIIREDLLQLIHELEVRKIIYLIDESQ